MKCLFALFYCAIFLGSTCGAFTRLDHLRLAQHSRHHHRMASLGATVQPIYNQHFPSAYPTSTALSLSSASDDQPAIAAKRPFRVRTITAFVTLHADDFDDNQSTATGTTGLAAKIDNCNIILRTLEKSLTDIGFEVQTVRVATNPFGEWLIPAIENTSNEGSSPTAKKARKTDNTDASPATTLGEKVTEKVKLLDKLLETKDIQFCSLGPSMNPIHTTDVCPSIIATSGKFSCSANVEAGDSDAARATAKCMQIISTLGKGSLEEDGDTKVCDEEHHLAGGLGNFRFCAASCVKTVPFFPGARAPSSSDEEDSISFAIGLENGGFACDLLGEAKNIGKIKNVFDTRMREELMPIQEICVKFANDAQFSVKYLGIDTSLNPSLDRGGSVADAIESLEEVRGDFGGTGSLAAAAAITTSLQSIPDILTTGYSGLMLPVLEDRRLAELGMKMDSTTDRLTIQKLLCISSVCGVGIDTVPIPGNASEENLTSLILDVAALAGRWTKPLSCRLFPVPGGEAGEKTAFDSPYMCNSCIFDV